MKVLSLILCFLLFLGLNSAELEQDEYLYINCATPCIPRNSCYYSSCDTSKGICVEEVKDVLPQECCFSASDCKTADCVFTTCNLDVNQCEYIAICSNPGVNITKKACLNDNQCQGENPCYLSKCIDSICQNSPLTNPNNDLCCEQASDCPPSPCSENFCDVETFTCFYEPILGCIFSFGFESVIEPTTEVSSQQSSSSSSSSLSSRAKLYHIPHHPDGGAIFFLIVGCAICVLVILIVLGFILYNIYEHFFGEDANPHHDVEEAAAAGHTSHGGHGAAGHTSHGGHR